MRAIFLIIFLLVTSVSSQTIRVGSKHFNESYILGEIISQLLESHGYKVERKFNLGGTLVCFESLKNNQIDEKLYAPKTITSIISDAKNKGMNAREYGQYVQTPIQKISFPLQRIRVYFSLQRNI